MNARRSIAACAVAVMAAGITAIAVAPAASAHPLGNFTHNTYVLFTVSSDRIDVDHVLDLAEVPTYQERRTMDADGNGLVSGAEAAAWGQLRCQSAAGQIVAQTDLGAVSWKVGASTVTFPQGQGGLPTTRLECAFTSDLHGAHTFHADVAVEEGRVGWHEVNAAGVGLQLTSDVPAASLSQRLTWYPLDVPPLDMNSVDLSWGAGAAVPVARDTEAVGAPAPNATESITAAAPFGLDSAAQAFTDLISRQDLTIGFALLAIVISVVLGGFHALAPGHGKTMMAASLVGTAGRRRDAVILGASVTTAHTAGVVVLAFALSVSSAIAAESAYPWLGLASGIFAIGVGVSLFRQARRGGHSHGHRHPHPHVHPHSHQHPHDDHVHDHDGHDHHQRHDHHQPHDHGTVVLTAPAPTELATDSTQVGTSRPGTRRVIALGLAGGLVPSPSAVVVLLAGFALGRSWFALLLVVAYGLGMALTLCLTGLLLVRVGRFSQFAANQSSVPRPVAAAVRLLPVIAAVTVMVAGLWLGVRSILAM